MKLRTIITLLVTLIILFTFLDLVKTGNPVSDDILWGDIPEWEKYYLDEDANKDKLYCRVTEDERGIVIETRWYNYFIDADELVRTEKGDTRTENCEEPKYKPIYLEGSNEGKVYSRTVRRNGNVIETKWYNACTGGLERTDKGDTTFEGSDSFDGKCYHPSVAVNGNSVLSSGLAIEKNPLYEAYNKGVSFLRSLLNM